MKVSKTAVLVLSALTCGAAIAAAPSSSVKLYGVLDTGVLTMHLMVKPLSKWLQV